MAEEAGVTICYGSDLLISMHALQTEEFTVRSRVLSPAVILKHATINPGTRDPLLQSMKSLLRILIPAQMLGQEGKLGVLVSGSFADLIVLRKNPLDDICILDRPEENLVAVMKEGRLVSGKLKGFPV